MFTVLLVALLATCALAPFLGVDTSDSRSESARPQEGWFPSLPTA